jgi:hypothetical protein
MNFFENELQKIFGSGSPATDIRFAGRACIGRLGQTTNVKLQFVTMGYAEHYEAVKATVFNRNEGVIDSQVFRFKDILGKKQVDNPNFRDGVFPHVWINDRSNDKADWYVYKPNTADYKAIADTVNSYLEVFLEPGHEKTREKAVKPKREPTKEPTLMGEVRAEQDKINAVESTTKNVKKKKDIEH